MGFWALHVDTLLWSIGLGVVFLWFFRKVAQSATAGVPGPAQNFVEWIIDFVNENVRGSFTAKNDMVAPLALTIFVWVFLMNMMDLVPVDLIPWLFGHFMALFGADPHHVYMKVVPTTDPNATFGMSLMVFALVLYYSFKIKGAGGFSASLRCSHSANLASLRIFCWRASTCCRSRCRSRCDSSATCTPAR
jgi:F-type H+-transporting ATPase subunit a